MSYDGNGIDLLLCMLTFFGVMVEAVGADKGGYMVALKEEAQLPLRAAAYLTAPILIIVQLCVEVEGRDVTFFSAT